MERKGKGAPSLLTPIVRAQHYTRITARQEIGNKALRGRSPTGHRFFRTVAARSLALDGDANSRPSAYESEASYKSAPSRVIVETRLLRPRGRFGGEASIRGCVQRTRLSLVRPASRSRRS